MKAKFYDWLAGGLVAAGLLLPQLLLAQAPAGCTSTYTATGTASGSAAGLFAQYYPGTFQTSAGLNEAAPITFFNTTTPGQSEVDPLLNYQSPVASGYVVFPVTIPPATNDGSGNPITFSARYRGSIYLKSGAPYTFTLGADDGAYLFLGAEATSATPTPNNAFIKNGAAPHGYATVSRQFTAPSTGLYDLQVVFGQQNGGAQLRFDYAGGPDNLAQVRVPQSALCAGPSGTSYASNQAPSANDATNSTVYANNTLAALSPGLSGFDLDGGIASYTVLTLPGQGNLKYNNSATSTANYVDVTAGQVILAANVGRLAYLSPSTSSTAGTFTFTYKVTDNLGAVSPTAATYSLPVVASQLDLATTLTSPSTAPQGSLVYFTATTTNNGPIVSSNTLTSIQLPTGLTGVSLSNSGTYNSTTGVASYPSYSLAANTSQSLSIAFTMPGSVVSGSATATDANFTDTNASNDTGTASTSPTQVADIVVAITGPVRAVTQQSITYTVVSTNEGPSTAVGVKPAAKLPTGLVGVVVSNGGSYNATNGVVTWPAVSTLATGSFLAYTVKLDAPATAGNISASGSATSTTANGDPASTNNDGTNGAANITTQVVSSAASTTTCIDPEATDPGYVVAPNTYYPGVSASGTTLVVGPALNNTTSGVNGSQKPLAAGDLLLVMQMQGAGLNTTDTDAYGDGVDNNNTAAGNLQDANFTAGQYEYAVVQSVSGTTVTIRTALINSYVSADATATQGQQRFQVVRVPRNTDLTLTGNLTGPRWNGRAGGVIVLEVSGTLNLNGFKIDMAGRGFRGGAGQQLAGPASAITSTTYRHSTAVATSGNKGEGTAGTPRYLNDADTFAAYRASPTTTTTPFLDTQASGLLPSSLTDGYPSGDRARGAPGNAGGGGTDGRPSSNDQNSGGGGGGNAGRGGRGGNGWSSNTPSGGYGGADFTQATPSRIVMGGGGGSGTTNNGTVAAPTSTTYLDDAGIPAADSKNTAGTSLGGFASSGAAGGGIVLIHAAKVSTTAGTIDVSGADMKYTPLNDGSGGGGAGGSVVLLVNASNGNANSTVLSNITVLANGGKGGSNTGGGSPHGPGGGGAGGLIFSSSLLAGATASAPASNGTTYGFETYGSGVGAADNGQAQSGITRADVPNQIGSCPADVVTTLTTNYTQAAPGTTITFTETTVNNGPGTATNVVSTLQVVPNLPASAFTSLGGGTYNAATGLITFPAVPTLTSTSQNVYVVQFTMPSQTVTGQAASTANNDIDPRTANNDGSDPSANVKVVPLFDIAGRIFDDVNYGGGSGRSYSTAEASARNSGVPVGASGSATGSQGTKVELYDNSGALVATTTTGPDGLYGFNNVAASGNGVNFTVRVVTSTVQSARNRPATGLVPVQTFRVSGGTADTERVGGEAPNLVDALANTGAQLLSVLGVAGTSQAESVASVVLNARQIVGVDFGYNFSTITNTRDNGAGSLRQFILNSNALPNTTLDQAASSNGGPDPAAGVETSIFMISDGKVHQGLAAGLPNQLPTGVASIVLNAASGTLPALSEANTIISGLTQTLNVGNTNTTADLGTGGTVGGALGLTPTLDKVASPEVQLVGSPGQNGSEYGLTLAAGSQTVTGLAIYGFGNAAGSTSGGDIYVTGSALTGTVIKGNVLGAAATSWVDPGASTRSPGSGIVLANFSSNNVGGVSATITGNLIGYHGGSGIEDLASGSPGGVPTVANNAVTSSGTFKITDNEVRGNGLSNSAATGLHLGNYGGFVYDNFVVGNQGTGLDLGGSTGSVTVIANTVTGNGAGGAATAGIRFAGAGSILQQNAVYNNAGAGILGMATGSVTTISKNTIYGNKTLGIDLLSSTDNQATGTAGYVTRNDPGDTDTGANSLLNFPMLYEASTYNGKLYITGYAPTKSTIEFFFADPSAGQFGQGKLYLASRSEGATVSGTDTYGSADLFSTTGSYGGTAAKPILINGMNQGNETGASMFSYAIPLSQFSQAFQNTLTTGTAYLTATATSISGSNAATSEFSGTVLVKANVPLPVELTAFTAQARTPDAVLAWSTAQEHNSDYYAVERSFDGQSFEEVGRVVAAGTSAGTRSYQFVDKGAARSAGGQPVYYRLRQVDFDGKQAFTGVQAVRFTAASGAASLSVYPSPTAADATLDLSALPAGSYRVRVLDAVGRLVYEAPAADATPLALPAATWNSGLYLIQVSGPGGSQTLRLTRE